MLARVRRSVGPLHDLRRAAAAAAAQGNAPQLSFDSRFRPFPGGVRNLVNESEAALKPSVRDGNLPVRRLVNHRPTQ